MHQMEEAPPPQPVNLNISPLKTEVIEQPIPSLPTPVPLTEIPSATATQMITVPIAPAPPLLTSTPSASVKKPKRGFRSLLNSRKPFRSSTKPATLLARPSIISTSTILPHSQQPILLSNQIAPIIPKVASAIPTNTPQGFTTYLVVDGNQGQLVQVANDGPKPVTFRNQNGQILQATPITVLPTANQPVVSTFPVNGDCSLLSNSSQTITTVRTSSSIDMQQQTTLTSDTTTMTTQQLTGIIHQPPILPTTIINGNNLSTYDNNSSLDETKTSDTSNLSLSLAQIAQNVNHRHRRSSSSSLSKKKRGRPRLYERDPFTNKPIKSDLTPPNTELAIPTITNTTLLMPGQSTAFNSLPTHSNGCSPLIFSNQQSSIPMAAPSLLQQHHYSYPSLLNGNTSSTTVLTPPTYNTYTNNSTTPLSSTTFPYSSQPIAKEYHSPTVPLVIPTHNLQTTSIKNTNVSNIVPLESSPRKSSNNDIAVHYIGGYVIRESSQPFLPHDNSNHKENHDQLRCITCQKSDNSHRFYDQEKKFCSKLCSLKSNEIQTPIITEPIKVLENVIPQQSYDSNNDEPISLPPDHGLPSDPSKWTVSQVGEFIARLTNDTIREAFYESEMDGQALLLMTQDHLRETMKIKLGPSLVISSEINKLRERAKTYSS